MKKILTLALSLTTLVSVAQIGNVKVSVAINKPFISNATREESTPVSSGFFSYTMNGTLRETFKEEAGLNLSGAFDYALTPRFFLRSGLTISYVRFTRVKEVVVNNVANLNPGFETPVAGVPMGSFYGWIVVDGETRPGVPKIELLLPSEEESSQIGKTNSVFVQIPILFGTNLHKNKISIAAGAVTSFAVWADSYRWKNMLESEKYTATSEFTTVQVGVMTQASFNFTKRFSVDVSGQHFPGSLFSSEGQFAGKPKMSLLAAGLSYKLR